MQRAQLSPRCAVETNRYGILCKDLAVRGWAVSRMHGASVEQHSGTYNSQWKQGLDGAEYTEIGKLIADLPNMVDNF